MGDGRMNYVVTKKDVARYIAKLIDDTENQRVRLLAPGSKESCDTQGSGRQDGNFEGS